MRTWGFNLEAIIIYKCLKDFQAILKTNKWITRKLQSVVNFFWAILWSDEKGRKSLTSHSFPPKGKFCFPHAWVPTTWPLFHPDLVILPGRLTGVWLRLSSFGIGSSAWSLEFYTFALSCKLYQRAAHRPVKNGRRPESKPRPFIFVHVLAGIISKHHYIFRGLP